MGDTIIVGIGNQYRGDDAVGWVVIDGLKKALDRNFRDIALVKNQGDIADLIDIFSHYKTVFLVDACQMNAPVGTWQRIDAHKQSIMEENPQTSTHDFGVSQAISIAKNLNLIPSRLILYVINGDNYSMKESISPAVAKSAEAVIQAILNEEEIQSCMNTAS